jgi:tetratricopeptide (TPR) repeat protein
VARFVRGDLIEKAVVFDFSPRQLDPLSLTVRLKVAAITAHNRDDRILQYQKILELEPDFLPAIEFLAWCYHAAGMQEKFFEQWKKYYFLREWEDVAQAIEEGYRETGPRGAGRKVADALIAKSTEIYISPFHIAGAFAVAEDHDEALVWLERAYQIRASPWILSKIFDFYPNLRADPRIVDLIQHLDFPK